MADHMRLFAEIKQGLLQFEERVDRRFEQIEARFASLEQKVEARFASLEQKFDNLGLTLNAALTAQRNEMHGQFRWTAGIILTGLVAIVAAILAR